MDIKKEFLNVNQLCADTINWLTKQDYPDKWKLRCVHFIAW